MRLLRTKEVTAVTGLSRMTIYRLELSGAFPRRRRLSRNSVGWLEEDIKSWIASRPAGPCDCRGLSPQIGLFARRGR
jgi:prophage regulatory protein